MITFDEGDIRFTYRVVGVAIDNRRVLLQGVDGQDFWALPGGRGELMEPARQTLVREMKEELDNDIEVVRLLWVVENFYSGDDLVSGKEMTCHELGMYFLMSLPDDSPVFRQEKFYSEDDGFRIVFKWHSVGEIEQVNLVPTFLKKGLKVLPETIEHIVHFEKPA